MQLPQRRGPISAVVARALEGEPVSADSLRESATWPQQGQDATDVLENDDLQLALWMLYELHYRGFDEVDDAREWDPALLALRAGLEAPFETALRALAASHVAAALGTASDDVVRQLELVTESDDGPSLAKYVQRSATREQFEEFLVHRSLYHLKESDPQSFVIARLEGAPKAALVELQYDEYGGGCPERLHATLFAAALEAAGLDSTYAAYVDAVPGHTLAVNNAMSLFSLHRGLRGAALGHLTAFEMTSSVPCRRFSSGIRRLGLGEQVAHYFDEHVEADAVHEQVAARDICGGLLRAEPSLREDVLLGAAVCVHLDALVAQRTLDAWESGGSTLLGNDEGAVA